MAHRYIRTDHPVVIDRCESIVNEVREIDAILDELARTGVALSTMWTGEAQRAFDTAHAEWDVQVRSMSAIARRVTALAGETSGKLTGFDRAAAQAWAF